MYLIANDYNRQIQVSQFQALGSANTAIVKAIELTVQEEVNSYLVQKYDTAMEFTDMSAWSFSTSYKALRRAYLDATAYSAASTYALNALTLNSGSVYRCTTAIVLPEAFNIAKWTLLGAQYDIFFVTLPSEMWNGQDYFERGQIVWWKDKQFTCLISNAAFEPGASESLTYWGTGTAYSVAAGTLVTDTSKWTSGDNRSQQLVTYMINMSIYYLSKKIAPNNIPQLTIDSYDIAKEWLKSAAGKKDGITANIPRLQPKQGYRTLMRGAARSVNNY